jgi:hypothetical protein
MSFRWYFLNDCSSAVSSYTPGTIPPRNTCRRGCCSFAEHAGVLLRTVRRAAHRPVRRRGAPNLARSQSEHSRHIRTPASRQPIHGFMTFLPNTAVTHWRPRRRAASPRSSHHPSHFGERLRKPVCKFPDLECRSEATGRKHAEHQLTLASSARPSVTEQPECRNRHTRPTCVS